jgi:putative transposase
MPRKSQKAKLILDKEQKEQLHTYTCLQSMSSPGDCYDNAVTESFFHILKTELVYHRTYTTRHQARKNIFKYIEMFYNVFGLIRI